MYFHYHSWYAWKFYHIPYLETATGEITTATVNSYSTTDNATPAANESPATFVLAGIVAILSIIILLLISLVILLFYKYKRAKQSHDVMGTQDIVQAIATDIDLNDNQAYGKAREAQDKAMPQEAGQTTELYDYIPNTLFQGHPPGAQTSAMDDSEGVVSSEVYQEISWNWLPLLSAMHTFSEFTVFVTT